MPGRTSQLQRLTRRGTAAHGGSASTTARSAAARVDTSPAKGEATLTGRGTTAAPAGSVNRRSIIAARGSAFVALLIAGIGVVGCGARQAPVMPIKIASAYVMQAKGIKPVDAYFVLANAGPADQLVAVRSSAGGSVLMLGPATSGVSAIRTLSEINIPAHSTTKLDPASDHLEIVGSGPLHQGTDITLTLTFAHAGKVKILAQVSNPETGDSGYFGP